MSKLNEVLKKINSLHKELDNLEEENLAVGVKINLISQELKDLCLNTPHETEPEIPQAINAQGKTIILSECKNLIGRKVKILNPKTGEPHIGQISKVGTLYVTVTLPGDIKQRRAAKNLLLIQDE